MTLKHIVAAVAAIFATAALAAGDPSYQRPSQGAGATQSQGGASGSGMSGSQSQTGGAASSGSAQSQGGMSAQSQGSGASQSPEVVRQAQQQLNSKGFEVGAVDGQIGPKTKEGVKKFQESQNIQPTGQLDRQTLAALGVGGQSSGSSSSPASTPGNSSGSGSSSGSGAMNQSGSGGSGPAKSGGPDRVIQ